jgi:hypothetical protein
MQLSCFGQRNSCMTAFSQAIDSDRSPPDCDPNLYKSDLEEILSPSHLRGFGFRTAKWGK